MKDPPHKPLADEHVKYILPVTSCWPPCPFTWPMDQRYRVLWTKGFSAVTCLLTFSLNSSYSSALSAYSSSDTLRALTFPLPSRTQPLSSTTAAHTSASAPLLHPGEDSPWSIPPLQRMPAMLPAFLLPTRATKAPSSHSTSYQGAFSSLPTPLHTVLRLQPHLPPALATCMCSGTAAFFRSPKPSFDKTPEEHQHGCRPAGTSRAAGDARVAWDGPAAQQRKKLPLCTAVWLFLLSAEEHTPLPGEGRLISPLLLSESCNCNVSRLENVFLSFHSTPIHRSPQAGYEHGFQLMKGELATCSLGGRHPAVPPARPHARRKTAAKSGF